MTLEEFQKQEYSKIMKQRIIALKECYPPGTRVELTVMDDAQAPPAGTWGTVKHVDDIGTIYVKWDNGSSLGVVYGKDWCRKGEG